MAELSAGADAPAFTLPRLSGGDGVIPRAGAPFSVLLFVKEECETCRLTLPFFGRIARAYGGFPIAVVAENDAAGASRVAKLGGLPAEIVHLEGEPYPASAAYKLYSVPSLFEVDAAGKVISQVVGWDRAAYEALAQKIAAAVGAAPVEVVTDADGKVPAARPG
jgi:hypothetical protein